MKLRVKSASFSTDYGQQYCPFFTVFLTIKTLSQNISITLLQISLKLQEHRGCYWRKKLPWMLFEEQFPVPRYTAASKIGNNVVLFLWQLRCRCNTDHNKFSSLSNTTVVAIFPKLCFWRRSLCSHLRSIDPEKLYRATLTLADIRPWPLVPFFQISSKKNKLKITHNILWHCRVHFFRQPFSVSVISKIQLVGYYRCCVLIGWATTRLYVIAQFIAH